MKGLFEGKGRICEEFSPGYYGICAIGVMLSAGTTHLAITPFDVLKVNMQAIKIRVQTQPHFAKGLADGFPKIYAAEGLHGLYRGLIPLWGRNLPYNIASLYNIKADSLKLAIKKIGFRNLFSRSLSIRIMLVGPVVTLQWLFYDSIKVLSGLPTSGHVSSANIQAKVKQP